MKLLQTLVCASRRWAKLTALQWRWQKQRNREHTGGWAQPLGHVDSRTFGTNKVHSRAARKCASGRLSSAAAGAAQQQTGCTLTELLHWTVGWLFVNAFGLVKWCEAPPPRALQQKCTRMHFCAASGSLRPPTPCTARQRHKTLGSKLNYALRAATNVNKYINYITHASSLKSCIFKNRLFTPAANLIWAIE